MKSPRFRAVVFDFDGVIVDSEPLFLKALACFLEECGIPHDPAVLKSFTGIPAHAVIDRILSFPDAACTREEAENGLYRMYRNISGMHTASPMPGVQAFFDLLKANGIRTALGTSRGRENVLEYIGNAGLSMDFDVIVTHEDVKYGKPHPETFLLAAQRLSHYGIAKEEIVVIEDSENGILAGKNAGLFVIGFKGSQVEQDTSRADLELFSYEEAGKYIPGI